MLPQKGNYFLPHWSGNGRLVLLDFRGKQNIGELKMGWGRDARTKLCNGNVCARALSRLSTLFLLLFSLIYRAHECDPIQCMIDARLRIFSKLKKTVEIALLVIITC